VAILQKRLSAGDTPVEQGLVQWSHMPPALSTWEPLEALRQQFPRAPAWGHAVSQEEGNVSHPEDTPGELNDLAPAGGDVDATGRPKRKKKPNSKLSGAEWTK
jgi:hypothetical protein